MKRLLALMIAALAATAGAEATRAQTRLVVYTTLEQEFIDGFRKAFEADNPDIRIDFLRDATGVITARLQAEKATPRADAIWGLAVTSTMVLDAEGILQPYRPAHFEQLRPVFRDPKPDPAWFGMEAWSAAVCFNTIEAGKRGLPVPRTWEDLAGPAFRGLVQMPNPASSGTGYFDVTAWLTLWGEDGGWKYMDALHQNIAQYTHSGSKPCNMAASGEFVVGISFEYRANTNKAKGAPIDLVFPKEGLGWDLEAFAIHKGTRKLDAAKKLADWASSKDAMLLYGKNFAITAQPGVAAPLANVPKDYEARLVKMDFNWAAENRERILDEWTKRYNAKTEKR